MTFSDRKKDVARSSSTRVYSESSACYPKAIRAFSVQQRNELWKRMETQCGSGWVARNAKRSMTQTETQDLKSSSLQQKLTEALGQRLSDVMEAGKACQHGCA